MRRFLTLFIMLMLSAVLAFAQNRVVTGKVNDDLGNPVPFATVTEAGTKNAVTADANGDYSIKVREGAKLNFTSIGHKSQTFDVSGNTLSATLTSNAGTLSEVVVTTALGIKRRPKEIGYANSTISSDQITNGKSPALAQALSGKVSGLTITNASNGVNPNVKITLRGFRSLTGNNDALIVLDGVPVPQNAIAYLNPNDIQDVTVLKGGQAATLYGSDGVNGAILISTKRGSSTKPMVNFTSTLNLEEISFLPEFQNKFGSGSNYGGLTPAANYRTFENQQYGDRFDGSIRPLGRVAESGDTFNVPYSAIPGERRRSFDKGYTNTNDVSVSGGDETSRFYLSFQDAVTKGIVPKDKSRRDQIRLSATKEFGKFTASFTGNYILERIEETTSDFYFNVLNQAEHIPLSKLRDWKTNQFANPNGYFNDYYNNPYFELDNERRLRQNNYFNGNVELNFKAFSWLNFTERVGVATTNATSKATVGQFKYSNYAKNTAYVPAPFPNDYDGIDRAGTDILGSVNDAFGFGQRINNDLFLTAKKDFGKTFSTTFILGSNIQVRRSRDINVSSNSLVIPEVYNVGNRTGELGGGEFSRLTRKYGYYADLTVGINDFIYLHGSGRLDGTSVFYQKGRDKSLYQYAYYGGDISIILTDAFPGIKNSTLSYLKLRGGYNKNGNDNLDPYRLSLDFPLGANFPYGNTAGTTVGDVLPDANLSPEFVTTKEVGLEVNFFNNRLNLDFSAYKANSKDQVLTVSLPPSTGFPAALINVGEAENWGYEGDLKGTLIKKGNLTWDVNVRYSYNTNKVISLFAGLSRLSAFSGFNYGQVAAEVGRPFPYFFGTGYVRDSSSGRVVVNANDGYPQRTSALLPFGNTLPKHQLGIGSTLKIKDFTFSFNTEYRGGNIIYQDLGRTMAFTGSSRATVAYDRKPFIWPNSVYMDASSGKFVNNTSVATANGHYTAWVTHYRQIAENFVTSAAFWKLRDVSFSYNLPGTLLGRGKFVKSAAIGMFGRNLITLLPKENAFTDPEFNISTGNGIGISDDVITPPVRSIGMSLSLNF